MGMTSVAGIVSGVYAQEMHIDPLCLRPQVPWNLQWLKSISTANLLSVAMGSALSLKKHESRALYIGLGAGEGKTSILYRMKLG